MFNYVKVQAELLQHIEKTPKNKVEWRHKVYADLGKAALANLHCVWFIPIEKYFLDNLKLINAGCTTFSGDKLVKPYAFMDFPQIYYQGEVRVVVEPKKMHLHVLRPGDNSFSVNLQDKFFNPVSRDGQRYYCEGRNRPVYVFDDESLEAIILPVNLGAGA